MSSRKEQRVVRGDEGQPSMVAAYHESHSGPLPHPELLAKYDNIIPNGAERIMRMAEKEQDTRHDEEKTIINAEVTLAKRGQLIGALLVVGLVGVATWLTVQGFQGVGGVIFGTTILGVAGVFVRNKNAKNNKF